MELQTTYKETEVGTIPTDWNVEAIEDVATVIRGASPRPKGDPRYYGGEVPRLMVEDVTRDGKYVTPRVDFLTKEGAKRSRPCEKGTLTIVCSGVVGVPSFLAVDACIHDGFLALVNLKDRVHDDYLYHLLESQRLRFDSSATHGGVFTNLTTSILRRFKIPLPPLPEQRAIADALSDVDALIERLDALIAKKRAIKTATMQRLLTGHQRLPGFSAPWTTKQLGEIGSTYGGLTGKTKKNFGTGSARYVPFLNIMNNVTIDLSQLERVEVFEGESQNAIQKGDLFFNTSSETPEEVGLCSTLRAEVKNVYLNSFCFGFRLYDEAGVDNLFLTYLFRSKVGRELIYSLAQGATRYNLSKSNFVKLEIDFPSLEEQQAIATILSDMDAEIQALQARRDKTQAIKQGMMQELLTGRTRLVEAAEVAS